MSEQLASLIRTGLKVLGGILSYAGFVDIDEGMLEMIVGAVMTIVGVVWSFLSHKDE